MLIGYTRDSTSKQRGGDRSTPARDVYRRWLRFEPHLHWQDLGREEAAARGGRDDALEYMRSDDTFAVTRLEGWSQPGRDGRHHR